MSKKPAPSPTGPSGRGRDGRFLPGNRAGKGNPLAAHVQRLRAALLNAVAPTDLKVVARKLLSLAKAGDVTAARELLQRTLGPPVETDMLERIEALEAVVLDRNP